MLIEASPNGKAFHQLLTRYKKSFNHVILQTSIILEDLVADLHPILHLANLNQWWPFVSPTSLWSKVQKYQIVVTKHMGPFFRCTPKNLQIFGKKALKSTHSLKKKSFDNHNTQGAKQKFRIFKNNKDRASYLHF